MPPVDKGAKGNGKEAFSLGRNAQRVSQGKELVEGIEAVLLDKASRHVSAWMRKYEPEIMAELARVARLEAAGEEIDVDAEGRKFVTGLLLKDEGGK